MKNVIIIFAAIFITILAVKAFARDSNIKDEFVQKETNQIKQGLVELEKKTASLNKSLAFDKIGDKISLSSLVAGAYQYKNTDNIA